MKIPSRLNDDDDDDTDAIQSEPQTSNLQPATKFWSNMKVQLPFCYPTQDTL